MKRFFKTFFCFIITAILLSSVSCSQSRKLEDGTYTVTVCATTDVHGAYFDSTYYGGKTNATSMSKVSSYIKSLREKGIDPILVDVGDNMQGDEAAYYFNYVDTVGDHLMAKIAEYIGYDAVTVGNHDIETGHSVYDNIIKELDIPYLAANADHSDSGEDYFIPYCITERNGIRVAIIGMTNANIANWLPEELWEGLEFSIISDFVQALVDEVIRTEEPDITLLAVHSGAGDGKRDKENEAIYLASSLRGVDAVLGGHDHTPRADMIENPYGIVPLVNEGTKAEYVGRLDFEVDVRDGVVTDKRVKVELVPMKDIEADAEFNAFFSEEYNKVKSFVCRKIGTIKSPIDLSDALKGPSSYINLINSAQLEVSGADVSFAAPLSSHGVIPAGDILFHDLNSLYRFENTLYVVEMTGRQIKDYLEMSYDNWVLKKGASYNYDTAGGINYTVSRSAKKGDRVRITTMSNGDRFDYDKTYKVAMTSYRASGGGYLLRDGAGVDPEELVVLEKYKDIRSILGDYIERQGVVEVKKSDNWKFVK